MSTFDVTLPTPTTNEERALDDLRSLGVAVLDDAVSSETVALARDRLDHIARQEQATGAAIMDDGTSASGRLRPGPNQRVVSLVDKDVIFRDLVATPVFSELAGRLFAESYHYPAEVVASLELDSTLLSSATANIASPGGEEMALHADQGFVPPKVDIPLILNVVLPLVDFTAENGATRVAPGSHLADPRQLFAQPPATTPVLAGAGQAILIDGRTWHGTGANRSGRSRPALLINYCRPWVRPFETPTTDAVHRFSRSTSPSDRRLAELQGLRRWFVYGSDS